MIAALDLIATEFVILAVVCGFLVHHYQSPLVTKDVSFTVYISWVFGYAAVLLLPYDLSIALVNDTQNTALVNMWSWVYWATFFLAWVVLPIQMEYHGSGHFSFKEKLLDALKRLLCAALAALIFGIVYIVYMLSTSKGSFSQVLGFTMAMGNTYGVLLITVLMGSGLVGIPKRLWLMSDVEGELTRLYLIASTVEDAYQEARYELEDCESEIKSAVEKLEKSGPSSEIAISGGEYIRILKDKMSSFNFAGRSTTRLSTSTPTNKDYADKAVLVSLHARLITSQIKARAAEQRWRHLVSECRKYQDSQNTNLSVDDIESSWWCLMPIGSTPTATSTISNWTRSLASCYFSVYKVWLTRFYSFSCKLAAIVFGVCSCLILWSEMVMASSLESPIGHLMGAYNKNPNPIMIQAVAFLVLAYMSICTYWTLFRMNIGWSYRLQAPQLSPPSSLIFNAEYLSRLQFALGYNFLLCLNISKSTNTAFSSLMNNIEIVPVFGTSFTIYVPIIMTLIALITLFDGFARILQFLGVETEDALVPTNGFCGFLKKRDDMDQELLEKCNNGKMVVANEIRQMNLMVEKLKRNRTAGNDGTNLGRESFTSTTSNSTNFITALKETVTKSTTGKPHYSNIEFTKPSSLGEDDDEDLENNYNSRSSGFVRLGPDDDDDLGGGSIFSSSLAGNNYQDFNTKSKGKQTSRDYTSRPSNVATKSQPSRQTTTKASNMFSIDDDDDDDHANVRGRYSDI